jgi:molybdopterin synthase catalytic subunit
MIVVHRVGVVGRRALGSIAVADRDAAFAACRFLIDELKRLLPIWKRRFTPKARPDVSAPEALKASATTGGHERGAEVAR